jgi:hypothetical protein
METMDEKGKPRWRGTAAAIGLAAAGAVGGGILVSTLTASAADSSTGTATPTYGYAAPGQPGPDGRHGGGPMGGPAPVRPDETELTGSDAAKAKAAALEAVPGGTVYRVETDAGDAAYEAHMTKKNGTPVTVKMDKNFTVTAVEDGMGQGDPRPNGRAPGNTPGSSSSA